MLSWRSLTGGLIGIAILVLLMGIYSVAPNGPRTSAELVGHYVLDCEPTKQELNLESDGTFDQSILIKSTGEVFTTSGKWTYTTSGDWGRREGEVKLDGAIRVLEWPDRLFRDYAKQLPGIALLYANERFGRITIGADADSWPNYVKTE